MPDASLIVVDASVVINLNATRRADDVLAAFPHRFLVTANVEAELRRGSGGRDDSAIIGELIAKGLMGELDLADEVLEVYLGLVAGDARATLDDGEAATIAMADRLGATAAIDERKARRLCERAFPNLEIVATVDLLLAAETRARLGREGQAEAVFLALRDARMHVREDRLDEVVGLIGSARARSCPSLPTRARS